MVVFSYAREVDVAIFGVLEQENHSNLRYARELTSYLPEGSRNYSGHFDGISQSFSDVFLKYPLRVRRLQGDINLVISVVYSHLLPFMDGSRTAVLCHDLHPLLFRGSQGLHKLRFRANLRLLPLAKYIITVSEGTRTDVLNFCPFIPPEKVVTVHSGLHSRWRPLPEGALPEELRQHCGLEQENFLLHVGSDNWYKNFSALLRGFAEAADKSVALVKVGRISFEERRLIATLGIESRIKQLAEVSDEQLVQLYNCAEALVFPSLHEGFGWPPLEAMACGCPVIAGDRPSLPEICGEAALYLDPEKPSEIAAAIARLRSEAGLRENLKRKGFEQAAKYDWKKTAQSILALFNS